MQKPINFTEIKNNLQQNKKVKNMKETTVEIDFILDILEKAEKYEKFTKTYYNVFLSAKSNNENGEIDSNDQFFLYAHANNILGSPNGKKLD